MVSGSEVEQRLQGENARLKRRLAKREEELAILEWQPRALRRSGMVSNHTVERVSITLVCDALLMALWRRNATARVFVHAD